MEDSGASPHARKDAAPDETLARIRAILESIGFERRTERWVWFRAWDDCWSCQLRYDSYPLLFANGKGVTETLARASAMAEFLERLQCRLDWLFTCAGNIHRYPSYFPARRLTFDRLAEAAPALARGDLADARRLDAPFGLTCRRFVDVLTARIVELPFEVMCHLSGTNGMCAGNTPEEAILHGLCEVFERHAIRQVAGEAVVGLPTVRLDSIRPASPALARLLGSIRRSGIEITVKDATLGGRFPVLAVVLVDPAADTCQVAFGADPDFDLALERCVTEAYQGATSLRLPRGNPHRLSRSSDIANTLELLADQLLADVGRDRTAEAFLDGATTNAVALGAMLRRMRRLGRTACVADCSVLGFPSYYVYVPGMSSLRDRAVIAGARLPGLAEEVRRVLFGLFQAKSDEVAWCGRLLFEELTANDPALERTFLRDVLAAPIGRWIGIRPVVAMMRLESGDARGAREMLDRPWPTRPDLIGEFSADCWRDALPGWIAGYRTLRGAHLDAPRLAEAAGALGDAPPASSGGGRAMAVPRCLSVYCCASCPCRTWCYLDEWYRLAASLRSATGDVDLAALGERLAGVERTTE